MWVGYSRPKGQISRSLTTEWAMILTDGLSGTLWIGGKPLTYLKPIIGNSKDYELEG